MSKQSILQKSKEKEAAQFEERVKKRVKENEQEKAEAEAARQLEKEDKRAAKADRKRSASRKIWGIFGGISDVLSRRKNFTTEELGLAPIERMAPAEIISKYVDTYAGGKIYGAVFSGIGWAFKDAKTGKLTSEFLAPVKEPNKKWLSVLAEYVNGEIVKELRQKDNPGYQAMLRKLRKPTPEEPTEADDKTDKTESKKGKADKAKPAPKKDKADKAKSKPAPKKDKADKAKSSSSPNPKKGKADKA